MRNKYNFLLACVCGALLGASLYRLGQRVEKEHSFTVARYAAEFGCLSGSQKACTEYSSEGGAAPCREDAIAWCPKVGEGFEKFLRH